MAYSARLGRTAPLAIAGVESSPGASYILDDFVTNRVVQPNESDPKFKYLWKQYSYSTGDVVSVSSSVTFDGQNTLSAYWDSAGATGATPHDRNFQLHFYTYTLYSPDFPDTYNGHHFAHEFIVPFVFYPNPIWAAQSNLGGYGVVNRFRFWIKVPTNTLSGGQGGASHNFEFGTFHGSQTIFDNGNDGVNYGWHFYHFADLTTRDGVWQQVIIDTHPQHQVATTNYEPEDEFNLKRTQTDGNGDTVVLDTLEPAYTYFDDLRGFYFDFPYLVDESGWGADTVRIGQPEFYVETADEDVLYTASLNGSYQSASNTIHIQWQRHRFDTAGVWDVKYAWSSIHTSGWAAGTDAPSGQNLPANAAWQGMNYTTTAIDITGHENDSIVIGIQRQGQTTFRQILIPLYDLS